MILLALALAAQVVQPAPACTGTDTALPAPLRAWTTPGERLAVGSAAWVPASPAATPQPHDRPGNVADTTFTIATAGNYEIALDQGGWIDVSPAAGGAPLESVAHGHGPACSTIRKLVRFTLAPSQYRLRISGLPATRARVLIISASGG